MSDPSISGGTRVTEVTEVSAAIEAVGRIEAGRLIAALTPLTGDLGGAGTVGHG